MPEHLQGCPLLEELLLSHNGISTIEGSSQLTNLRLLDLSNNRLEKVQGLDTLTRYGLPMRASWN